MDKRRQSILKQEGRIPLQETMIPDFPEEDTATATVTKSRRVSFGANFVKEFIVGSAVSTKFLSEYEQAFSSSDSSNPNSSQSGLLDRSTFHSPDEGDDDALNLCVKPVNHDDVGPLKNKFCTDKSNLPFEIIDKNNENIWDFNLSSNGSNIFTEKNTSYSNKSESSRNSVRCNKNVNSVNNSVRMDKQMVHKKNEAGLNCSKLNETFDKKTKVGKFSSTIIFSADSPTDDVEFTEGCINLAKSIFDKKKRDMKVYIKGSVKDGKSETEPEGSNTVFFETDDSDVGMKLTKCMDESESDSSDLSRELFSSYIPSAKDDSVDKLEESIESTENGPFHMYSLNGVLGKGDNSEVDEDLDKSLFYPEKSLTEMLRSDPSKTISTTMTDFSPLGKDNTEECDMEISTTDVLKPSIVEENFPKENEESIIHSEVNSTTKPPPPFDDEDDDECPSPVFSKDIIGEDFSLTSEDTTAPDLAMSDPLKISLKERPEEEKEPQPESDDCHHDMDISISPTVEETLEIPTITEDINIDVQVPEPTETATTIPSAENVMELSGLVSPSNSISVKNEENEIAFKQNGSFQEDKEVSAVFNTSKTSTLDEFPSLIDEKVEDVQKTPERENQDFEMSSSSALNSSPIEPQARLQPDSEDDAVPSQGSFDAEENQDFEMSSSSALKSSPIKPQASLKPDSEDGAVASQGSFAAEENQDFEMSSSNALNSSPIEAQASLQPDSEDGAVASQGSFAAEENQDFEMSSSNALNSSPIEPQVSLQPDSEDGAMASQGSFVAKEKQELETSSNDALNTSVIQPEANLLADVEKRGEELQWPLVAEENQELKTPLSTELNTSAFQSEANLEMEVEDQAEVSQITFVVDKNDKPSLQETRFGDSSFMNQSIREEEQGDRISLGDRKILGLITEQSEESNCCWRVESISSENLWSFSFPILKSSAVMKFKLMPPKDKSLVSFSVVLDTSLELRDSNRYQLEKDRIGINFAFSKLKTNFHRETYGLDNVHKIPLFLDKMNLIMRKIYGILNQATRILKEYPGSKLKESVLSFRVYSFPLLFSYLIAIDMSDPFQLSEKSITVKKHFGNFNVTTVKSIFKACLDDEEVLIQFIRTLTETVVGMERETGAVTIRSHIRLLT